LFAGRKIWLAFIIVFVSSACTLVVELVAGRIMAPYIGVSLYTWTSIIGVVLAGISLGNYLGGVVADRRASAATLGLIFVASGLASAGILATSTVVLGANLQLPLLGRIVLSTTAIFFLPSVLMGMVSPVVIKLALADLRTSGNVVGSIYAFSTVGSIFGTFITGFWLISWLGTRAIIWMVAATLLALGIAIGGFWRPFGRLAVLGGTALICAIALWANESGGLRWFPAEYTVSLTWAVAVLVTIFPVAMLVAGAFTSRWALASTSVAILTFGLLYLGWSSGMYNSPCLTESNYFCIRVQDTTVDGHDVRALVLDHLVHSYVSMDDPTVLGYGYERIYAEVTNSHLDGREGLDTLFIGGGGYTFPRYLEATLPDASIDVIEIDPAVTEATYNLLGLARDTRIRSFNQDARAFLLQWQDDKRYDIVYGDAFNDLSVPYHLTTVEFNRLVAARMKDDGVYLVNVIDKYPDGEFMKAFLNSLKVVFPHVHLLAQGQSWQFGSPNTYILLASHAPFDEARLQGLSGAGEAPLSRKMPDAELATYLASGRFVLLTDDYAPVDQMVAPLFVERSR
jgi:predicted membrane-bound spermidine synthase